MAVQVQKGPKDLVIRISGRFDFSCHAEFKQAYTGGSGCTSFVVDMGQVTYMDSAALGMLLLLRDHATSKGATVAISNCKGQPSEVLKIANFDKLFKISA
jgi:anti-anti-sigma factor